MVGACEGKIGEVDQQKLPLVVEVLQGMSKEDKKLVLDFRFEEALTYADSERRIGVMPEKGFCVEKAGGKKEKEKCYRERRVKDDLIRYGLVRDALYDLLQQKKNSEQREDCSDLEAERKGLFEKEDKI